MTLDKNICPICGSKTKMDRGAPPDRVCLNGRVTFIVSDVTYDIFGVLLEFEVEDLTLTHPEDSKFFGMPEEIDKFEARIEYWKEDDKYLLEILSRR